MWSSPIREGLWPEPHSPLAPGATGPPAEPPEGAPTESRAGSRPRDAPSPAVHPRPAAVRAAPVDRVLAAAPAGPPAVRANVAMASPPSLAPATGVPTAAGPAVRRDKKAPAEPADSTAVPGRFSLWIPTSLERVLSVFSFPVQHLRHDRTYFKGLTARSQITLTAGLRRSASSTVPIPRKMRFHDHYRDTTPPEGAANRV